MLREMKMHNKFISRLRTCTRITSHSHSCTYSIFFLIFFLCICAWELEINPFADISLQSFMVLFSPFYSFHFSPFIEHWLSLTEIPSEFAKQIQPVSNKNSDILSRWKQFQLLRLLSSKFDKSYHLFNKFDRFSRKYSRNILFDYCSRSRKRENFILLIEYYRNGKIAPDTFPK